MTSKDSSLENHQLETELASIQQFITKLKNDLDSAGFLPNKVVTEGIQKSKNLLDSAIESMSQNELVSSLRASKVAWIHAFFARSIFDAEMTEQYLGEQNFLELKKETHGNWREFVESELADLEEEIIQLREEIKGTAK